VLRGFARKPAIINGLRQLRGYLIVNIAFRNRTCAIGGGAFTTNFA
jgi:hypothetical protein